MAAFGAATADVPEDNVHVECFFPKVIEATGEDAPFAVVLQKTGKTMMICVSRGKGETLVLDL